MCIAANIFLFRMIDGLMTSELFTNGPIDAAFIGSKMRVLVDAGYKDRAQIVRIQARNMT